MLNQVERFRKEWGDTFDMAKWPDWVIEMGLCTARSETGGSGWGQYGEECDNFKWQGMKYFTAHWLCTFFIDGLNGDGKLIAPSEARLNVAQKAVGDESIGFRVAAMMDAGNDWLTYTVFGQMFYRLKRRAGMGARVAVIV